MDATDTYPESHRVTAQIAREIRTARGARARNIPPAVATPLPPRNRTYGENMWPSTAASPSATVNHAGPLDQGPSIATGTAPLTMSITPTGIAYFQPSTRYTLVARSEEHTSELQSRVDPVCRLLLEKKN